MDVWQGLTTRHLYVEFADNQTHGSGFVGDPCTKYLEYVSAMKNTFKNNRVKLIFGNEGCTYPNGK